MPSSDRQIPRPRGRLFAGAINLGFSDALATQLVNDRPQDLQRWIDLGEVPPDEDPRVTAS